jgi:hypothetical protein
METMVSPREYAVRFFGRFLARFGWRAIGADVWISREAACIVRAVSPKSGVTVYRTARSSESDESALRSDTPW